MLDLGLKLKNWKANLIVRKPQLVFSIPYNNTKYFKTPVLKKNYGIVIYQT